MRKVLSIRRGLVTAVGLAILAGCGHGQSPMPSDLPEAGSAGARWLMAECNDCHVAPQPSAHTAAEWPAIVERMQTLRLNKGLTPLSSAALSELMPYLQRNARGPS